MDSHAERLSEEPIASERSVALLGKCAHLGARAQAIAIGVMNDLHLSSEQQRQMFWFIGELTAEYSDVIREQVSIDGETTNEDAMEGRLFLLDDAIDEAISEINNRSKSREGLEVIADRFQSMSDQKLINVLETIAEDAARHRSDEHSEG